MAPTDLLYEHNTVIVLQLLTILRTLIFIHEPLTMKIPEKRGWA